MGEVEYEVVHIGFLRMTIAETTPGKYIVSVGRTDTTVGITTGGVDLKQLQDFSADMLGICMGLKMKELESDG